MFISGGSSDESAALVRSGYGLILGVSGIAASRADTANLRGPAEQTQTHHSSALHVSTPLPAGGFGGERTHKHNSFDNHKAGANARRVPRGRNDGPSGRARFEDGRSRPTVPKSNSNWLLAARHIIGTTIITTTGSGASTATFPPMRPAWSSSSYRKHTLAVTNNAGFAAGFGLGYWHSRGAIASSAGHAQRHGLSVGGLPVVGPIVNPGTVTVRLAGVASPVAGQPFAAASQQHLAALSMGKPVRIFQTGVDPSGAIVGQVFVVGTGMNLNERQVRDGMAYNTVGDGYTPMLAAAEEAALMARAGMWNGKPPIAPWLLTP